MNMIISSVNVNKKIVHYGEKNKVSFITITVWFQYQIIF